MLPSVLGRDSPEPAPAKQGVRSAVRGRGEGFFMLTMIFIMSFFTYDKDAPAKQTKHDKAVPPR